MVISRFQVVEVAISCNPPTTHCSSEAISSMLMSGIASYSVGSGLLVGIVYSFSWAIGVVVGTGGCCLAGSRAACCEAGSGAACCEAGSGAAFAGLVLVPIVVQPIGVACASSSATSQSWCYNPPCIK